MHSRSAAVLVAFIAALSVPARGADLAKLVPEDVLLYAEVTDPAGIWTDFEQSGFRDIIRSVPQAEVQLRIVTAIVKQVALNQFGVQWDAFVGDYLLVAKSDAILRQCIDAKATAQGLAAAPRYSVVAGKKPPKHNALLFGDVQALLMALVAGRSASPVARIAEQLRGACLTVAAEGDGVLVESYTRPGLLPLVGALVGFAQKGRR